METNATPALPFARPKHWRQQLGDQEAAGKPADIGGLIDTPPGPYADISELQTV